MAMAIIDSAADLRAYVREARSRGARVGFVPTMGFLHAGHLALVELVRSVSDVVITSIFVNPTQFSPTEDFSAYPRDPAGDAAKLEQAGCDVLYQPRRDDLYPSGYATFVQVEGITSRYEGAFRPDHFRGVATIVAKLFNIVMPDVAAFGQKDAQQAAVIRRMVADLNFPIEILVGATVREDGGLAMSSRNVYLSAADRVHALTISAGLRQAKDAIAGGDGIESAERAMRAAISSEVALDYADIVNAGTFEPARSTAEPLLAVVAGRVGSTRLIDNMPL